MEKGPSMPCHVRGKASEQNAGDEGCLPHKLSKPTEPLLCVLHTQRGNRSRGNHRDRKAEAESSDHRYAERHSLELQADQENSKGCRTRHQTSSDSKKHDLRRGDAAPGETPHDLLCVLAFVGVLKLRALLVFVEVFMSVVMMFAPVVIVVMVVVVVVMVGGLVKFTTGAEKHPGGQCKNCNSGADLEIRLNALCVPLAA